MMTPRRPILVEAYTCSPYHGSEPGVGWNIVSRLSRWYEVYVITEEEKWRGDLERYAAEHPEEMEHLHFFYLPKQRNRLLRRIWPPSYYRYYRRWQREALRLAQELDEKYRFEVVHHVTMAGFRAPGYLWKLRKPFIWGPVGGLNNTPWFLLPSLGVRGALFLACRNLLNTLDKCFGRDARAAAAHATCILSSTADGVADIRRYWQREATEFCELGTDGATLCPAAVPREPHEPLRVIWVGLLAPRKALSLLLRALPMCPQSVELHVVGDGEMRRSWETMSRQCGEHHRVIFHGNLAHEDVFALMRRCHAACITSVRDDTSTVTLEYLQSSLPIVALNHCGFGAVVDASCGIKVELRSCGQVVRDIAHALTCLSGDEALRRRLSRGAAARAKQYAWEHKMQQLRAIYEEAATSVLPDGRGA